MRVDIPEFIDKLLLKNKYNKHVAIIFRNQNISKISKYLAIGVNKFKSKGGNMIKSKVIGNINSCISFHAEVLAMKNYERNKRHKNNRNSINLFVGRATYKDSEPCISCFNYFENARKRKIILKNIYYTNGTNDTLTKVKFNEVDKSKLIVSSLTLSLMMRIIDKQNTNHVKNMYVCDLSNELLSLLYKF